ncbi:MAG TPA: NUDIX domain-containing protein [Bacillota bacterium]|nr:NUDIX domain-containing protein [Bacillota bacterium]
MENEYLDIFSEQGQHIGKKTRLEAHQKGLWHQTFHCWIVSNIDGKWHVLLQKRHSSKDTNPNLYDVSAAGHLLAGEGPEDGVRELEEELGLTVEYDSLLFVKVFRQEISYSKLIDREMCHVYFYECNQPLQNYQIQIEEVSGLVRLELEQGIQLFSGELQEVECSGFEIDEEGNTIQVACPISKTDFVPHSNQYYRDTFEAIRQYSLRG